MFSQEVDWSRSSDASGQNSEPARSRLKVFPFFFFRLPAYSHLSPLLERKVSGLLIKQKSVENYLVHREQLGILLSHLLFSFRHLKHAKDAAEVDVGGMIHHLGFENGGAADFAG